MEPFSNEQNLIDDQKSNIFHVKLITPHEEKEEISCYHHHINEDLLTSGDIHFKKLHKMINNPDRHDQDGCSQIIPSKLQTIGNITMFTFCKMWSDDKDGNGGIISDSGKKAQSKIVDFSFLAFDNSREESKDLLLDSAALGIEIPILHLKSFGLKNYSNLFAMRFPSDDEIYLVFLVVFNWVFILKVSYPRDASNLNSVDEFKYEILFRKQFELCSFLLFLGSDDYSENPRKFYLMMKPSHVFLLFTCQLDKDAINVVYEEKNLIDAKFPINRISVSNSPGIVLYDKKMNSCFLIHKRQMNQVRPIKPFFMSTNKFRNCFAMGDNKHYDLFLITDEKTQSSLVIKLWQLSEADSLLPADIILKQSVEISANHLGDYTLTQIDNKAFAVCFYDMDEIFLFVLGQKEKLNERGNINEFLFKSIHEIRFDELYAYAFDYQISEENILALTMYQEDEFIFLTVNLTKGSLGIIEAEKKNQNHFSSENSCAKSSSLDHPGSIEGKKKSNESKKQTIISQKNASALDNSQSISSNSITDFKKTISDSIVSSIEDKFEKIVTSKLNLFADTLNSKLENVFGYVKKQTEELEEIRKKNSEAMSMITNLILEHRKQNSLSTSNVISSNVGPERVNNMQFPIKQRFQTLFPSNYGNSQVYFSNILGHGNTNQVYANSMNCSQFLNAEYAKAAFFNRIGGNPAYMGMDNTNQTNSNQNSSNGPLSSNAVLSNPPQNTISSSGNPQMNQNEKSNATLLEKDNPKYKEDTLSDLKDETSQKISQPTKKGSQFNSAQDLINPAAIEQIIKPNAELANYSSDISSGNLESDINMLGAHLMGEGFSKDEKNLKKGATSGKKENLVSTKPELCTSTSIANQAQVANAKKKKNKLPSQILEDNENQKKKRKKKKLGKKYL